MRKVRTGLGIFFAIIIAVIAVSAGTQPAPKTAPKPAAPAAQNPKNPASYHWFKSDGPKVDKVIVDLNIGVGEEIPIYLQTFNSSNTELKVCPNEWKYDTTQLQVTKTNDCHAIKVKGLKTADNVMLNAVFEPDKDTYIQFTLRGKVGKPAPAPKNPPAPKSNPAPKK
jgi:hypothetical protein